MLDGIVRDGIVREYDALSVDGPDEILRWGEIAHGAIPVSQP